MIRRRILGPVYSVAVTLKREAESCAGLDDFSTYDKFTDSFAWRQFEDAWYMLVPAGRKKNVFHVTVFVEVARVMKDSLLRKIIDRVFRTEFFPTLCGIYVTRIGRAVLMVNPAVYPHGNDEDVEFHPESFLDMVMHS